MHHIDTPTTRVYRSQLRPLQARETRERILDAAVRVMAKGPAGVSVPAVAREAGVSVPTVYRHFGTKADLLAAVYPYLARRAGIPDVVAPTSIDGFREMVRALFGGLDSLGDVARAAMASPAAEEARHASMPDRLGISRQFLERVAPDLAPADRDRIARILVVLTTSAAMRMWRDHLGATVDEAADDVDWVLRVALAAATPAGR
jgi:AcrR family transcriptional regulator